ncbi:hypothetical protein [Streptomyces tsukubensis]|uniref:hypothetical protein n=1 Tax=Streptomyces tsukubensis TaxID=83656 RepID=UPI00344C8529
MFTRLFIRRPRRLRHLRRLAATAATAPATLTRLPHRSASPRAARPEAMPGPAADTQELRVRAWLHHDQYGSTGHDEGVRR